MKHPSMFLGSSQPESGPDYRYVKESQLPHQPEMPVHVQLNEISWPQFS